MSNLSKLSMGDVAILSVRKVTNGKISIEFAEKMQREANNSTLNVLGLLNAGDPAFEQKARRAWAIGTADNVAKLFNLDEAALVALEEGTSLEVFIKNPSIEVSGIKYNYKVVINETTEANEYQKANVETTAKRRGANGEFITSNGQYIFSNTSVVGIKEGEVVKHTLLVADTAGVNTAAAAPTSVLNSVL